MASVLTRRTVLLSGAMLTAALVAAPGSVDPASAAAAPVNTINISASVEDIAFSRDGATLAGTGLDGTVRLWSTSTGKAIGTPMTGHSGVVKSLAFHPNGRWLVTGGTDSTIRFWDLSTRKSIATWKTTPYMTVGAVAFSPDSKTLAGGVNETVYEWNIYTGARTGILTHNPGFRTAVSDLAFSPDGKILTGSCMNNLVQRWNPATGQRLGDPMFHSGPALEVAFSPDGKTIASADGGAPNPVRLWSAQTGQFTRALSGHTLPVSSVAYRPDGKLLASGSADASVLLWNPTTGAQVWRLFQGAGVTDVAITPNGRTLAANTGRQIKLWDITGV